MCILGKEFNIYAEAFIDRIRKSLETISKLTFHLVRLQACCNLVACVHEPFSDSHFVLGGQSTRRVEYPFAFSAANEAETATYFVIITVQISKKRAS